MTFAGERSSGLTAACAALFVFASALHAADAADPRSISARVVAATKACYAAQVRVTGYVRARREAVVTLDMDGYRVDEVMARPGDRVSAGQTLARLARQAGGGGPGGQQGGGSASAGQGPASISLQSPAEGIVTRSSAAVGATSSQKGGDPLFMIAAGGDFEVEAEVPAVHLIKVQSGQPARVRSESGREASGRVRRVLSEINPATQLGKIRIALDPGASLRIGTFVRGSVDAERPCGVWLPRSAILFGSSGTTAQVVRNGAVETRRIRIGAMSGDEVEIIDGISDGDIAIAFAGTSLRDGDKVTPVNSETGAR